MADQSKLDLLTRQERRVVEMLVDGYSREEIMEELAVVRKTIKYHLRNAYSKLEVRNQLELLSYFHNLKLQEEKQPAKLGNGLLWSEDEIREAAQVLVSKGIVERKQMGAIVADLLLALEGKIL